MYVIHRRTIIHTYTLYTRREREFIMYRYVMSIDTHSLSFSVFFYCFHCPVCMARAMCLCTLWWGLSRLSDMHSIRAFLESCEWLLSKWGKFFRVVLYCERKGQPERARGRMWDWETDIDLIICQIKTNHSNNNGTVLRPLNVVRSFSFLFFLHW